MRPWSMLTVVLLLGVACTERSPLQPDSVGMAGATAVTASGAAASAAQAVTPDHPGRPLHATLTGAAEVPPGDPDGSGTAHVTLNQGQGEVCFELTVADIEPATAAHIHRGAAGVAGPIVVPLVAPTSGSSSGCVTGVNEDLIKDIRQNPSGYYVNVHNATFRPGAVRGQLEK